MFAGAAAYYSSTLYSLNTIITDADQLITAMSSFNSYSDNAGDMIEQAMNGHYLGEAQSISSFLSSFPEYQNKTYLSEIANIYGADHIVLYEMSGKETVSSNTYTDLDLHDNANNEMADLLHGRPYVSLPSQKNTWGSGYIKKIGILMTDTDQNPAGVLEVNFNSNDLEKLKNFVSVDKMFGDLISSGNRRVFIIDKEIMTFKLTPNKTNLGDSARDYGFSDEILKLITPVP